MQAPEVLRKGFMYRNILWLQDALKLIPATALLLISFFLLPVQANAADPSLNGVWRGHIGNYRKNIMLCLSSNGQSGYHDLHDRKEIPLDRDDSTWLEKTDGKITARWELKVTNSDHLEGVRIVEGDKSQEIFSLNRVRLPHDKTPTCDSEIYKPQEQALNIDKEANGKKLPAEYAVGVGGSCIVINTGTLKCWGVKYGKNLIPSIVPGISDASAVAGDCVLLHNGTVKCLNFATDGYLDKRKMSRLVSGITNALSLVSGSGFYCALLHDGKVKCWGSNYYGQLGNGRQSASGVPEGTATYVIGLENVKALSAHNDHACAVSNDGNVHCWGNFDHYPMRGDKDQSANHDIPLAIQSISGAIGIASGDTFDCALLRDHGVKCWGDIDAAWDKVRPANATSGDRLRMMIAGGASQIHDVMSLSAGDDYVCALLQDGTVKCWGNNFEGSLGDGTQNPSENPVKVIGITDAIALSVDYQHSCVLIRGGGVKCWGRIPLGDGVNFDSADDDWNTAVKVRLNN